MTPSARKARWIASVCLLLLAAVFFGAAVYYWLYKGNTWMVGPFKIRLHQWHKPWLTLIALWTMAVLIRPAPFIPAKVLFKLFHPWPGKSGEARDQARAWTVLGAGIGAGVGYYLADIYFYRFPLFAESLLLIIPCVLISGVVHWTWGRWVARPVGRLLAGAGPEYLSGLRSGLYVSVWLLAALGPLQRWDGRFYDPLWPLAAGFFAVIGLTWIYAGLGLVPFIAMRRKAVFIGGLALLAAVGCGASLISHYRGLHPTTPPRLRVIFITLDATRADHLSCYGYQRPTSPHVDAVARQGARFSSAICPMGLTDPSHTSMFTGMYPRSHGVTDIVLPITGAVPSLPEYFRDHGFSTAAIASRYELSPAHTLNLPGFDYESVIKRGGAQAPAPATFRRAASWLARHRDENIFMWAHFFDAHSPYIPHPGFSPRFTESGEECRLEGWLEPDQSYPEATVQRCVDLYDGEIAYADYWAGRLISWVNGLEPKSAEPPLIVLLADHGEAMGEYQDRPQHFGFGHGGLILNAVSRIPLIISWPGHIKAGTVVDSVAETVDLAPTLVDYVFGAHDYKCQGRSLRPLLEGAGSGDDIGFFQRWKPESPPKARPQLSVPGYAVFKGAMKLVVVDGKPQALYDLSSDMDEKNNLLLSRPGTAQALLQDLDRWMEETPEIKPALAQRSRADIQALKALGYLQ